jgi:hypothetical protein
MSAIYAKSFLAGLAALILAVFLSPLGFLVASFFYKTPPGYAVSWDLRSMAASPWYFIFPLAGVVIFGIGFVWEYRRASRQTYKNTG